MAVRTTWWQRLALIALGVVLAMLALEVGLRAAGVVWLWARERRNVEALTPGGTVRVLCLGESTTALGGESSYPRELERVLDRDGGGRTFSVVNAGIPGITTDVVLARLDELLDRYRPHVVVTMLGINDGLVAAGGARRLPAFSSLRVVKLIQLLMAHLRAADEAEHPAPLNPLVAAALARLATGDQAAALERLRAGASAADASPEVVRALAVVLAGSMRFDEADRVVADWLARHPGDAGTRDVQLQVAIARAAPAIEARRLDEAEAILGQVERGIPADAVQHRAAVLAKQATVADLRGDHEAAARLRTSADELRQGTWLASTERNYREIVRVVRARGTPLVAMQYPLRSAGALRTLLGDTDVTIVENDQPFRDALRRAPWETWFTDAFAGDFGHTTPAGAHLLAEDVAPAVLAAMRIPTP